MFQTNSCELFCEGLCEDATVSVPLCRCSRVVGTFRTALLPVPAAVALVWRFGVISCQWLLPFLLTTFSDGCLGSNNDEGRSEVR